MAKIMADLALRLSTNVAELHKGVDEANSKLSSLQKSATAMGSQLVTAFAKVSGIIMGLKGTFEFIKSSFNSTGITADKFAATIEGVKQGFDAVKRAVATMDFKDFIKNVKGAIEEGRRYAENLDDLDEKTRSLKMAEADASAEILKQQKIQRSALSTQTESIAAGKKIIKLEEDLATIRTGIAKQGYDNEITNIAQITKLTNTEVEAYLRGEKAISNLLKSGEEYNKALKEQEKLLFLSNSATGGLTDAEAKRYGELIRITSTATDEVKRFAFASKMMSDDPKLNLAVEKYVNWQEAANSATENTLRTSLRLDSTLVKEAKTVNDLADAWGRPELLGRQSKPLQSGISQWPTVNSITDGLHLPKIKFTDISTEQEKYAELTKNQISTMQGMFSTMFSSIEGGWSGMGKAFGNMLKQMAIQVAAYAAVFIALKLLFPESGMAKGLGSFGKGLLKVLGFAEGTNFAPGGLSLVGERGPELVNLPRGSQVFNNRQSSNMMGGGAVLIKFQNGSLEGYMDYQNRKINGYR